MYIYLPLLNKALVPCQRTIDLGEYYFCKQCFHLNVSPRVSYLIATELTSSAATFIDKVATSL